MRQIHLYTGYIVIIYISIRVAWFRLCWKTSVHYSERGQKDSLSFLADKWNCLRTNICGYQARKLFIKCQFISHGRVSSVQDQKKSKPRHRDPKTMWNRNVSSEHDYFMKLPKLPSSRYVIHWRRLVDTYLRREDFELLFFESRSKSASETQLYKWINEMVEGKYSIILTLENSPIAQLNEIIDYDRTFKDLRD